MSSFYYQGSYTTGPSEFQHFSRTVKDHIYKNPRPVIARKTETTQTNQQTMKHFCYVSARVCSFWSISLSILEASSSFCFEELRWRFDCATYWPVFDRFFKRSRWAWYFSTCVTYWRAGMYATRHQRTRFVRARRRCCLWRHKLGNWHWPLSY